MPPQETALRALYWGQLLHAVRWRSWSWQTPSLSRTEAWPELNEVRPGKAASKASGELSK